MDEKFMFPAKQVLKNLGDDSRAYKLSIDIIKYASFPKNGKVTTKIKTCRKKIISKHIGYICYFIVEIESLLSLYQDTLMVWNKLCLFNGQR